MPTLPTLGPRGEGWVAIQVAIFAGIAWAGWFQADGIGGVGGVVAVVIGTGLIAAGAVMAIAATLALNSHEALTAVPHPRDEARLVETGVYGLARHPIYGGLVLGGLGWSLARGSVGALAGTVILLVFFDLKRRREEAWLVERFPGYAAYQTRTRRLLPWIY